MVCVFVISSFSMPANSRCPLRFDTKFAEANPSDTRRRTFVWGNPRSEEIAGAAIRVAAPPAVCPAGVAGRLSGPHRDTSHTRSRCRRNLTCSSTWLLPQPAGMAQHPHQASCGTGCCRLEVTKGEPEEGGQRCNAFASAPCIWTGTGAVTRCG